MSDRTALNKELILRRVGRNQTRTTQLASQSANAFPEGDSVVHSPRENNVQANMPSDALARPKCELDQLRSTIETISARAAALSTIEKEIDATRALMTTLLMRRNSLTPVFLLPPELLARVFHFHTLAEPPWSSLNKLGWIKVTHVCRNWRQVALDHASLWARISGFPVNPKWITEQLSRAKNAPLIIDLLGIPTLETISMFPSHLPHTRELRLRGLTMSHVKVAKELCDLEAPDLEHFELGLSVGNPMTSQDFLGTKLFKGKAPKLRTLSLCQVRVPWSFFPRCQFSQLKIILFEEEYAHDDSSSLASLNQLIDVLTNCPTLEVLVLESCLPSIPPQSTPKRTVHLPHLSHLSLAGSSSRVVRFFEALKMPSSTRLNLHCVAEGAVGNDGCLILPLVLAHFNYSALVTFRSFRVGINHLERSLDITASTTAPVSTATPSGVFDGGSEGSPELALSFITHSEFSHLEYILERACTILPIAELEFLSISAPDSLHSLNWGELFQKCAKVTTIEASGHGTSNLLRTITPPRAPSKQSNNGKGKKNKRGKRDVPSQAVDNAPVCVPIFPKLTSLLVKKFDFSELVPHSGVVYDVLMTAIRRRKSHKIPLKMLSIDRSILSEKRASALEKLVRDFHWSGEEAMSINEYDFDDFDHYSSDYHDARWEDFFVGSSQAEWEWWENYSDGW
ncbi:hypothetical protein BJY52DRAFT_1156139 [Lactarius psammicola]|nr:hypothetical protein BJY52DRAFT_1156139 [Lactarius psammicola]